MKIDLIPGDGSAPGTYSRVRYEDGTYEITATDENGNIVEREVLTGDVSARYDADTNSIVLTVPQPRETQ